MKKLLIGTTLAVALAFGFTASGVVSKVADNGISDPGSGGVGGDSITEVASGATTYVIGISDPGSGGVGGD